MNYLGLPPATTLWQPSQIVRSEPSLILSASQIQTFEDCERKWAWRYLEGLKTPPNESAQRGTRVHAVIEKHLKTRTPLDLTKEEGRIALAGADLWPAQPLGIEAPFILAAKGHFIRGFIDLTHVDPDAVPVVTDHKTTTDFKWAKTREELINDIQAVIYSLVAFSLTKAAKVRLRWIYYRTRGAPKRQLVQRDVEPADIAPAVQRIESLVTRLVNIPRGTRALSLAPNTMTCEKYGGCAFRERCNLTSADKLEAIMNQAALQDHQRAMQQFGQQPVFLPQGGPPPGQPAFLPQQQTPMPQPVQQQQPQYQPQPVQQQQPQFQPQPVQQQQMPMAQQVHMAQQAMPPQQGPDMDLQKIGAHWEHAPERGFLQTPGPCPPMWEHLNRYREPAPTAVQAGPPAFQPAPAITPNFEQPPAFNPPQAAQPTPSPAFNPPQAAQPAQPAGAQMVIPGAEAATPVAAATAGRRRAKKTGKEKLVAAFTALGEAFAEYLAEGE